MKQNISNTVIRFSSAGLLLVASVLAIQGQTTNTNSVTTNTVSSAGSQSSLGTVELANQVYGHQVLSSDHQKVGNLNNLVVDLESGRILYGVIGTGASRVAVPPEIFSGNVASSNTLQASFPKQKLDGAPQFGPIDKANTLGSAAFLSQVYSYFGLSPWWQGSNPADQGSFNNVHKASKLMGIKVENVNNQPMGTIHNLAVDLPAGRVVTLILAPDSALNLSTNRYPLPPQAFTLSQDKKQLVSNIDGAKLASAPHYAQHSPPNWSDSAYIGQIYQFYGKQPWFNPAAQPTGR
jgi:sporulation protein YlmC with PRC-barrel domain